MHHHITGVVRADVVNSNGRLYTREALEKAVEHAQANVRANRMLAHMGWSPGDQPLLSSTVAVVHGLRLDRDGWVYASLAPLEGVPLAPIMEQGLATGQLKVTPAGYATTERRDDDVVVVKELDLRYFIICEAKDASTYP